jgi:hypothetical protein
LNSSQLFSWSRNILYKKKSLIHPKAVEPLLQNISSFETYLPKSTFFFTFLLHSQINQDMAVRAEKAEQNPWMADKRRGQH